MTEELRKRLEEAQTSRVNQLSALFKSKTKTMFEDAFNLGYKEAIAQAKEWLDEHGKLDKLDLVEFDMEMNKLWEEQK